MAALLTKSKRLPEKTYRIISTYKNSVGRSYRIAAKMPTEWLNMTWLRSGGTLRILNNIKSVAAERRYRMAEAVLREFSAGGYRA